MNTPNHEVTPFMNQCNEIYFTRCIENSKVKLPTCEIYFSRKKGKDGYRPVLPLLTTTVLVAFTSIFAR